MKRLMLVVAVALGTCLWAGVHPAVAQDDPASEIGLPGLQADAEAYMTGLTRAFPAGASTDQKSKASDAARAALESGDATKALAALETLIGAEGDSSSWQAWLALGQVEMGVSPSRPKRALQAGWMAFTRVDQSSKTAAADQVSALRVMDRALPALNQPVPELEVLQAIARRQPQDPAAQQAAALAQQKVGLVFRHLSTNAEAFPARACLAFIGNPSTSPDFHPGDWVKLAPPLKDAARHTGGAPHLHHRPARRCHHDGHAAARHARRQRDLAPPGSGGAGGYAGSPASPHLRQCPLHPAARGRGDRRPRCRQPLGRQADARPYRRTKSPQRHVELPAGPVARQLCRHQPRPEPGARWSGPATRRCGASRATRSIMSCCRCRRC